ncbi:ANTAR domain-containing protein [Cellulomonas endometrii]|uniref:ANTAR domain-containing protein n=1 Tax=Cellulomonas endometrii TaxID=3036301 RepID=UPI0024AE642B|nr:ANTAR domain-containing protein [Cellulomonas endometrii]
MNDTGSRDIESQLAALAAENAALRQQLSDLEAAARSWCIIGQALGIFMAEIGCDSDTALAMLRSASQRRNKKADELAGEIIERVGGRVVDPPRFSPRAS